MAQPVKHPASGIYLIRRKVPKDLQSALGHEYKRSLGTRDPGEAKRAFALAFEESEKVFALARAQAQGLQMLTARDLQILAGRWFDNALVEAEALGDFSGLLAEGPTIGWEQGDHTETYTPLVPVRQILDDHEPDLLDSTVLRHAREALRQEGIPFPAEGSKQRLQLLAVFREHVLRLSDLAALRAGGDWSAAMPSLGREVLSVEQSKLQSKPQRRLLDAFDGYAQDRFLNDGKSREVVKSVKAFRACMVEFTELVGDLPLNEINREVVNRYRAEVVRLPRRGAGIRSMRAPAKIAKAEKDGLPRIGPATVRNKLRALSAVLTFALRMQYIVENPVVEGGIGRAATRAASRQSHVARSRNHYDTAELKTIFASPAFSDPEWRWPSADYGRAWYWLPLLMYYTGARREEIAQLWVRDVKLTEGEISHLNILNAEADEDEGRSVKTAGSRRLIPLHADLERLGFFEYVRSLDAGGQLFPKLKRTPAGYYGTNFGKRWAQYLKETVKLQSPANPSHGFRHTFKTLCRTVGIPEEVGDRITGHAGPSRGGRGYGEMPLPRMAQEIAKFPSAPLALLGRQG